MLLTNHTISTLEVTLEDHPDGLGNRIAAQPHDLVSKLNVPAGRRHVHVARGVVAVGDVDVGLVVVVICKRVVQV